MGNSLVLTVNSYSVPLRSYVLAFQQKSASAPLRSDSMEPL